MSDYPARRKFMRDNVRRLYGPDDPAENAS